MALPVGKITLCPTWAVKHECVFVEFLRLRGKELTAGEMTAVACTVACFERIRATFPEPDYDMLSPDPKNTIMVERDMSLGEIDDCLASCDIIIDHLPPEFFQHVRDVTGLQDQLRKQWKELDAENVIQGLSNWKGDETNDKKTVISTSIGELINMRNNFILLIKNKGRQFLSFEAMLCVCRGFKAIEDLENSIEGFPSSQRLAEQYNRVKLNDVDLPKNVLGKIQEMKVPTPLFGKLKVTSRMCAGDIEALDVYGCFKDFLSLPGDPTIKDPLYGAQSDTQEKIEEFVNLLNQVRPNL